MLLNCGVREDDCKEIQPVHPKGNQSWIFTGRTDAEAEVPNLWPPDGKDPDAGKNEGQRRRGWQRMRWRNHITDSMDMNLNRVIVKDSGAWRAAVYGAAKCQTQLSDWKQEQPEFTSTWKLWTGPYWKLAGNKLQILRWDHLEFRMGPESGDW